MISHITEGRSCLEWKQADNKLQRYCSRAKGLNIILQSTTFT
jgi:hypothetical protein